MSKKFGQTRRLVKTDGTVAYVWEGKLHSWEGPALIPEGNNKQREYYIHGIQYSQEEWDELKKDRQGIPFYKNQSMKNKLSDYRN
mgnify:FL=1|tara:strand:- start:31 stop:285 length:255 start_codon:yes stop_codon:yes gene_type:complete